jgi:DNA-binding MarR family transcriptional regulator
MPRSESASAPVPPGFVVERYLAELPADLSDPLTLLFALRRCLQRVNADLAAWLGPEALSPGRMQMLMVLWANDGPVRQSDLTRILGVSRASVSELIEKLVVDALATIMSDPRDGRRSLIGLTPEGRGLAANLLHQNALRLQESFSGLDADETMRLIKLLEKLCRNPGEL